MAPDVNTGYNNLKYAMEYKTNLRRREMNNTIRIYTEDKHLIVHLPYSPDRVKKMHTISNRK